MLEPEVYLEDALTSQRVRSSIQFPRSTPNFQKLSNERMLVPITLHLQITPTFTLLDHFDWDLGDQHKDPRVFAEKLSLAVGVDCAEQLSMQIYEQIVDHVERYTVQTRTRIGRRPEDQVGDLTCLNCDSILYNCDKCRACGASLEKLRQKYGQLNLPAESKGEEEESVTIRQTERQKNMESVRKKLDSSLSTGNKKLCSRCGEANHPLSLDCRQCSKALSKATKRMRGVSEALAYQLWRLVNKDSQFAQSLVHSDIVKEEDFVSPFKLRGKLQLVVEAAKNPPLALTAHKARQLLELLESSYEKTAVYGSAQATQAARQGELEWETKDMDLEPR